MNLLSIIFLLSSLQVTLIKCDSKCSSIETCGKCIGFALEKCVWCSAKNHANNRCESEAKVKESWCAEELFVSNQEVNKTTNDDFTVGKDDKTVQIKPQEISIKTRPGDPASFVMSYKPAKDYPLDVYYLMDASYSMSAHRDKLKSEAENLHRELTKLTNNVRFGVGSFIDKHSLPYAKKDHTAFSFRNNMKLTDNMTEFTLAIDSSDTGANFDDPEAGLEALMQAMVCDGIGWRSKARRIIVLCTESTYHSAGDGKMAGVVTPNNMKCHLGDDGYDNGLTFDYPSVSQINYMATKKNFKIIFAVLERVKREYEALAKMITGAKYVELKEKSNIAEIIKSEYELLVQNLEIEYNVPSYMELKLNPSCTKDDLCAVKHNSSIDINVTLEIKFCPENIMKKSVSVGPVALDEKLLINVEIDCQCDCERSGQGELNSESCSKHGTLQCGICKCNENRSGEVCQCSGTPKDINSNSCLPNVTNHDVTNYCSGRGKCICGKCKCYEQKLYYGNFCELKNECPRPGGETCSGRGECVQSECVCEANWGGIDCGCTSSTKECVDPYSKKVCAGHGDCVCGKCECYKIPGKEEKYTGLYCEDCEECTLERCKKYENYVVCVHGSNKTFCDEKKEFAEMIEVDVFLVNETDFNAPAWRSAKRCKKVLDDETTILFKHRITSDVKSTLIIQIEKESPAITKVWVAVLSCIGAILLIGLLTVIAWKILVDLHDKREYNQFAKKAQADGFDISEANPLYENPAHNFSNPTYESTH